MRFSMLYSGEQILSFKSCFVFYAEDSLNKNNQNIIDKKVTVYNYKPFHTGQCLRRIAGGNVGLPLKTT